MSQISHNRWMNEALDQARIALAKNEVPIGAVLRLGNETVGRGHNSPIGLCDPTAHAEVLAIRNASKKLQNYRLPETTLYVTLEPCAMCLGAMIHARINRIVFGASDPKNGVCGSSVNLTSEAFFNHKIIVKGGILEQDCKKILQSFLKLRRQ